MLKLYRYEIKSESGYIYHHLEEFAKRKTGPVFSACSREMTKVWLLKNNLRWQPYIETLVEHLLHIMLGTKQPAQLC